MTNQLALVVNRRIQRGSFGSLSPNFGFAPKFLWPCGPASARGCTDCLKCLKFSIVTSSDEVVDVVSSEGLTPFSEQCQCWFEIEKGCLAKWKGHEGRTKI